MTDPIYYEATTGKWYYYDETWADSVGPFDTREEADLSLMRYCAEVLNNNPPEMTL